VTLKAMSLDKPELIRCDSSATFAAGVRSDAEHGQPRVLAVRADVPAGPILSPRLSAGVSDSDVRAAWGFDRGCPSAIRCPPDDREILRTAPIPRIHFASLPLRHDTLPLARTFGRRNTVGNVAAPGAGSSGESRA